MECSTAEGHPAIYAILKIVGEILKIVKRIDDMIRRRRERRRFNANIQEACYHYWVLGQQNAVVRFGQRGRVTYESVFNFFRREYQGLGVCDPRVLRNVLRARSKRICTRSGVNAGGD